MASQRALKDALQGTQKRLERAEALLAATLEHIRTFYMDNESDVADALGNKIALFLNEPIDTGTD